MAALTPRAPRVVLALNAGSSSLKFGLYEIGLGTVSLICEGEAEELGGSQSRFWFQKGFDGKEETALQLADAPAAFRHALQVMKDRGMPGPDAIGHRIVHGGNRLRRHARITSQVFDDLEAAVPFAPLHAPPALRIVAAAQATYSALPHVACLDTAFHRTMPDVSRTLPLPAEIRRMGVERYGFHGLSVESIVRRLSPIPNRLVVAHLGGGCSITAVLRGESIDNSMGLTPTGGIPMGTRSGDLDPGVILFLLREKQTSADQLEEILDRRSGLVGLSEISSDMRELEKVQADDSRASLALRVFSYQVRKSIAAMAAALGGLDALAFTGGIGEHAQAWRDPIVQELRFLGPFTVVVLPSQEDLMIATITAELCG